MNNKYAFIEMSSYNDIIAFMSGGKKYKIMKEDGFTKIVGVLPAYGDYPNMLILEKEGE